MVESDIRRNDAAEHTKKHHDTTMPGRDSDGSKPHAPETSHDEEHNQEEHKQAERNITMKDKISPSIVGLGLSLMLIAALGFGNTVQAASINSSIADYGNSAKISTVKFDGLSTKSIRINPGVDGISNKIFNDSSIAKTIKNGIYAVIVDKKLKERISIEVVRNVIQSDILKSDLNNIIDKEDIAY